MNLFKNYAKYIFEDKWTEEDHRVVLDQIKGKKSSRLVDLGCGDGRLTKLFAEKAKATEVVGVEPAKIGRFAKDKKIKIVLANLNYRLPLKNSHFDYAISHFSIEHLYSVDVFMKEVHRILKKGGVFVVATDNLASWPNVLSLLFGWQPFSSAYGAADRPIGNPFATGGDFIIEEGDSLGELSHNKVLAYQALKEIFEVYGFTVSKIEGVGYFPFFGSISKILCKLDTRHSHLLIVKAIKK